MVFGAKRLGYGGETTRVENRGETTRGETTRGETSWGRNVLLPFRPLPNFDHLILCFTKILIV